MAVPIYMSRSGHRARPCQCASRCCLRLKLRGRHRALQGQATLRDLLRGTPGRPLTRRVVDGRPVVCENRDSGSVALILVDETAEDISSLHHACRRTACSGDRTALVKRLVRTAMVEVVAVRGEHPLQMPLV